MMAPPKIGPRGITIQDVQRVASSGLPKDTGESQYVYAPPTQSSQAYNPELLAALMAGQAQPSYGQKYGGFPTRDMLNDAALGYALNIRDIGDYAGYKAAELNAPLDRERTSVLDSADGYDLFAKEIAKGRAKQSNIRSAFGENQPSAIMDLAGQQRAKAEKDRQAAIAKYRSDAESAYTSGFNTQVAPYQQIAETIYDTPISQLARQALMTQYGVDPNVARATFTEQTDLDYAKLQRDAELAAAGVDFSMNEAELIYNAGGLEALQFYQDEKAYNAMYGTPAEQAQAQQDLVDAQNAPIDAEIFNKFGVTPKEINADTETVRSLLTNPDFVLSWITPSLEMLESLDGKSRFTTEDIAGRQAQAYLEKNPQDLVTARALAAIIAEFDFYSR
jgi:hypothetical protein